MKIKRKVILWLWLLCLFTVTLRAQEVVTASGGYGETTSARVAWTIGEPVTETICGTNSILTQGFNQGDLIITLIKGPELPGLILKVFPNPANDNLRISAGNEKLETLKYVLIDMAGKVVSEKRLTDRESEISVSALAPSAYLLKVYQNKIEIGVFKIIKK